MVFYVGVLALLIVVVSIGVSYWNSHKEAKRRRYEDWQNSRIQPAKRLD